MTDIVRRLEEIEEVERDGCGGKATSLSLLLREGHRVSPGACITTEAYQRFIHETGVKGRMALELSRKSFEEMRWEEMWDMGLRMRNMFLSTPLPPGLETEIMNGIPEHLLREMAVVRSSSLAEDSENTSFAGIHDSFVNIPPDRIMENVKKVWSSLWSDRAILYRKEISLDLNESAMAVLVQRMIPGRGSGVIFTRDPEEPGQVLIETVPGLNQGMVDGTVPPDRWSLDRETGGIHGHERVARDEMIVPTENGVESRKLEGVETVLGEEDIRRAFVEAMSIEALFGRPQDIEFTFRGEEMYILQARPITTFVEDEERGWYRTLRRSFDNLLTLRERIEGEIIPSMIEDSERMASIDLGSMTDGELASEIHNRIDALEGWETEYHDNLIPFAHGMRLFGEVYNDVMRPEDPHQFLDLLATGEMLSTSRNRRLIELAIRIREEPSWRERIRKKEMDEQLRTELTRIISETGGRLRGSSEALEGLRRLLLQMLDSDRTDVEREDMKEKEVEFLSCFEGEERGRAETLLDLARTSYRLRDDDNLILGRIEGEVERATGEGRRRLGERISDHHPSREEVVDMLLDPEMEPAPIVEEGSSWKHATSRQLVGQPAIKGIATGKARVVLEEGDLFDFQKGEVLVCDSLDPNMTFVAPICSAIVERRGGMLIHGAIIAREYGIPCVTGIPDLTDLIENGDTLTVDGFLGIVTIKR
jgi:pyruvate,water dikinase